MHQWSNKITGLPWGLFQQCQLYMDNKYRESLSKRNLQHYWNEYQEMEALWWLIGGKLEKNSKKLCIEKPFSICLKKVCMNLFILLLKHDLCKYTPLRIKKIICIVECSPYRVYPQIFGFDFRNWPMEIKPLGIKIKINLCASHDVHN